MSVLLFSGLNEPRENAELEVDDDESVEVLLLLLFAVVAAL